MSSESGCHVRIEALREQIARLEDSRAPLCGEPADEHPRAAVTAVCGWRRKAVISSGCPSLDQALPEKGFRSGTLVEWLAAGDGSGAAMLALLAASQACRQEGAVVVLDRTGEFYPPAAVGLGIEPRRLIVVYPGSKADHDWALDQSLRCSAVAAVVAWPDALGGTLDGRTFRRLQLAAEEGGSLGLLIRPETVRRQPSWADVRLLVEPLPTAAPYAQRRRLRVFLLRCRGGASERQVKVEVES